MSENDFAKMVALIMDGRSSEAYKLYEDSLEARFQDGEEYAMDTVGEWNRP